MIFGQLFIRLTIAGLLFGCLNGMALKRDELKIIVPIVFAHGEKRVVIDIRNMPLLSKSGIFAAEILHSKIEKISPSFVGFGGRPDQLQIVAKMLAKLYRITLFVVERLILIKNVGEDSADDDGDYGQPGSDTRDGSDDERGQSILPRWAWELADSVFIEGLAENLFFLSGGTKGIDTSTLMRLIDVIELPLSMVPAQQTFLPKGSDLRAHMHWLIDSMDKFLESLMFAFDVHVPFWEYQKMYANYIPDHMTLHGFLVNRLKLYARLFVVQKIALIDTPALSTKIALCPLKV